MRTGEHPEELLDRGPVGDLTPAERVELETHLAACSACALHLALATRLRDPAPAAAADEALNRLAVASALTKLQARPRLARRMSWRFLRVAAASVLLIGGFAAAAVTLRAARQSPAALGGFAPGASGEHMAAPRKGNAADSPRPAPEDHASEHDLPPPPEAPPSGRRPDRSAKPLLSAAALFAQASDLRREGRLEEAVASYRVLQRRYPRTREAIVSFALTGNLELECDRPAQALVAFDRYLEINQEVSEEALAGRAEALRRLRRVREEALAWQRLLSRFPGSIYAKQGRRRLAALGEDVATAATAAKPAPR